MTRCEAQATFFPYEEDLEVECLLEEDHDGPHHDPGWGEWEDEDES